jgi:hypothetical protein
MKTVTITLTQEDSPGLFRVQSFTNTIQLSIGMLVKVESVEQWCATPRINVRVVGKTNPDTNETPQLTDGEQVRHDALALPGES